MPGQEFYTTPCCLLCPCTSCKNVCAGGQRARKERKRELVGAPRRKEKKVQETECGHVFYTTPAACSAHANPAPTACAACRRWRCCSTRGCMPGHSCSEHSPPYCPEASVLAQHARTAVPARTILVRRDASCLLLHANSAPRACAGTAGAGCVDRQRPPWQARGAAVDRGPGVSCKSRARVAAVHRRPGLRPTMAGAGFVDHGRGVQASIAGAGCTHASQAWGAPADSGPGVHNC